MKIINQSMPSIVQPSGAKSEANVSARDRAIAKLMEGSSAQSDSQKLPVSNATQVAPEEFTALTTKYKSEEGEQQARQTDTNEAVSERSTSSEAPESKSSAKEDSLSSQYAILARKEKALRAKIQAQESAVKSRDAEFKAKEDALKAKESEYSSRYVPKDEIAKDPFKVLADLGLTYDQLTELAMNAPKPQDVARENELRSLKDELRALREEQQKTNKSFEESQSEAYNQAKRQMSSDINKLVKTDPSFELIRVTNSVGDVVELIERTFKEDGELLSVEEASSLVESYLEEEALRISKINKIQQKLRPNTASGSKQNTETKESSSSSLKTLTNNVGSSAQLSSRDRAILAFKGELKK